MSKRQIFLGAIVLAVLFFLIAIYYIVPGYDHLFVTHDSASSHFNHFIAFFGLAVISGFVALVNRSKGVK
ncbi:hypothetical protein [Tengunoibacter tsumagoiensis]|uniref:Uncharacterized protein n=1 Tax=Tengunoibacter tsumagoiensis TaxID=2014871 RepID=A0A402A426_9CHLR|nr:hypothetical protein [Tengunoibacter tsumagoiensis]GCE13878.1 hypothetical protein KTT_37370 [Tengunoibacter tsumagoiensis]